MIPKIIHFCWFGDAAMPELATKCINSWKKHLPDYSIMEWNENNFDIDSNLYVKQAYKSKKYAFVTDYVRLHALYHEGGIYMDTDVEVLGNLDEFLVHKAFSGFEEVNYVPTGIMAAERESLWIRELLGYYDNKPFILNNGSLDMTTNTKSITEYMVTKGLKLNDQYQDIDDLVVMYPHDYFCPKDHATGIIHLTSRSVCIHHFAMSWVDSKKRRLVNIKKSMIRVFGTKVVERIIKIFNLKQLKKRILK